MTTRVRFPKRAAFLGAIAFVVVALAACDSGEILDGCAADEPGVVCAVAGTGELGFNRDGKPPEETDFFLITRARRGPDALLYFLDFNNWRIRRLDPDDRIRTVAGNGFHAPAVEGMAALDSPLDNPTDFAFMPDGRLVMVSFEDPRVVVIDDGINRVLAGTGEIGVIGDEGDEGPPLAAQFIEATGIAVSDEGVIYVADAGAHRIRRFDENMITTVAGTGEQDFSGDGGDARLATLNLPTAVALGPNGGLFIADTLNHAVRRVAVDGTITTVAGTGEAGLSGDNGPADQAQLNQPNGLAVAANGTIYIADRENFRVRKVSPDGTITTIAGTIQGNEGNEGQAVDAQFGHLARLTLDGASLLVADQSNSVVRRVILDVP